MPTKRTYLWPDNSSLGMDLRWSSTQAKRPRRCCFFSGDLGIRIRLPGVRWKLDKPYRRFAKRRSDGGGRIVTVLHQPMRHSDHPIKEVTSGNGNHNVSSISFYFVNMDTALAQKNNLRSQTPTTNPLQQVSVAPRIVSHK